MLQNRNISIDSFIRFTAGGVQIADFDQVLSALSDKYKSVYGSDIDLSNTTADGVFVNDMSLIINNILQSFKTLYSNLNVDTASGVYLDSLCRLSNVSRKTATFSTATLLISATVDTVLYTGTVFVDGAGVEWVYSDENVSIIANANAVSVQVTCSTLGAITAPIGWISQTLESTYLSVDQATAANIGQEDETDAELRNRRAQSVGSAGTTVLESLVGSLLSTSGIEDVNVYNNNSSGSKTANDGTTINAHNIYAVVRYSEGVDVSDETIASIIYEKLTPGISTTQFTGSNGTDKSYDYVQEMAGVKLTWVTQTVYWKKATAIAPTMTVVINPYSFFNTTTCQLIIDAMISYMNNLALSTLPTTNDAIITAVYADPKFKNAATYGVTSVTLPNLASNPDTYFNYTSGSYTVDSNTGAITITLS